MTARRLEKTDLTALAALYAQFWDEAMDEAVMRRQWEILEAGGRHILLAAEDGGRLVYYKLGDPAAHRPVMLAWRKSAELPRPAKALVEFLTGTQPQA